MQADSELGRLMARFPRAGRLEWIGLRPQRRAPLIAQQSVIATSEHGLDGDHYAKTGGNRQVTLIQFEHLQAVGGLLGLAGLEPSLLRRNLVVSGINLYALRDRRFHIGDALFEGTGECAPCSRMEEVLGEGGYNAMRGHGGITARILESATIRVGDAVSAS